MKTFQVVIPSLNQGRFVRAALESLLVQSCDVDLELVVVDGCSVDDTFSEIDAALTVTHSAKVTVVSERDRGQSDAINKGVALGRGEIVSWLNTDDRLLPGALDLVDRFWGDARADVVAVYGDVRYIDELGRPCRDLREQGFKRTDLLWGPCYIPQPSTFIQRWAWEQVGGLREDLHYAMDLDLWLRLSEIGAIVHVPVVLAEFRFHPQAKSVSAPRSARAEAMLVRRYHAARALSRTPSRLELEARHFGVRCRRKLRFGLRALAGVEA